MTGFAIFFGYILLFALCFLIVKIVRARLEKTQDLTARKTVTFGDESAVRADRYGSILSVIVIFLIWGMFTDSKLVPFHVPGPFTGTSEFNYLAEDSTGQQDEATVALVVYEQNKVTEPPAIVEGDGFAKNDQFAVQVWRSKLIRVQSNDIGGDADNYRIIAIDGQPIAPGEKVSVAAGSITMTAKGALNFNPASGIQMQPLYLPSPENVVIRFIQIAQEEYRNTPLWQHVGFSLFRVIAGFILGSLIGIPLGYAMGLSGWFRGWLDPIVEFMRPVPPLALIPLVIIWFGIWETGKTVLLFLAALWIMIIAARSGVSGVNISKIHASYSLGASKWQILRYVIIPNSLPEIFTGARVAMGVCWGTVVAAELVAAQKGVGMMIIDASKFQRTDIVIMGIIIIGIIGFGIDIIMRVGEKYLVPWKGRS